MRNRAVFLDGRKLGMGLAIALLILGLSAAPAFGQTQIVDCDAVQAAVVNQYNNNNQVAIQIQYNSDNSSQEIVQIIAIELGITQEQVQQCFNISDNDTTINDNDTRIVRGDDGDGNDIDIDNTDRNDVDIDNTDNNTNINTNTNINDVNGAATSSATATVAATTGAATSSATATVAATTGAATKGGGATEGGDGAAGTVGLEKLPDTGGLPLLGSAAILLASVFSGASVLWAGVRRRR